MRRRRFLALAGAGGALVARGAGAQQGAPLVGVLGIRMAGDDDSIVARTVVARLRELGFEDGRNVAFAIRLLDGRGGLAAAAAELARLRPAVMVVVEPAVVPAVAEAMPATAIVTLTGDPVSAGFAQSLARPGGMVTGVATIAADLGAKRLEILAEILPRPATVLILADAASPAGRTDIQAAAPALGLALRIAAIDGPDAIDRALGEVRASGVDGIGVLGSALFSVHRHRIIALAAAARLPTIFHWAEIAHDGSLLAYGPSQLGLLRELAGHVARILRGERPADIPIERPARIMLAVNLRVARELGLTIPPTLLARADEVIE